MAVYKNRWKKIHPWAYYSVIIAAVVLVVSFSLLSPSAQLGFFFVLVSSFYFSVNSLCKTLCSFSGDCLLLQHAFLHGSSVHKCVFSGYIQFKIYCTLGFPCGSAGKESACNLGDLGSIPGLGRSSEEKKSYLFQYSGLENSMDCIAHGVTKSWIQLSDLH